MLVKQLVLKCHWTQAADIVKSRKMGEFHVATFARETRNEHKLTGSWIGYWMPRCWKEVMVLVKQMVLERDEGLRLIVLKISRNVWIP